MSRFCLLCAEPVPSGIGIYHKECWEARCEIENEYPEYDESGGAIFLDADSIPGAQYERPDLWELSEQDRNLQKRLNNLRRD